MKDRFEKGTGTEGWADESQGKVKEYVPGREDAGEEVGAGWRRHGRRKFRATGSVVVKTVAFLLLAISCLAGLVSGMVCIYMGNYGFYTEELDSVAMRMMAPECRNIVSMAQGYIEKGNFKAVSELCRESNLSLELLYMDDDAGEITIWSCRNGSDSRIATDHLVVFDKMEKKIRINSYVLKEYEPYLLRAYIDQTFPHKDNFSSIAEKAEYLYQFRYIAVALVAASILLGLICFLFLLCGAGRRNGREGIVPSVLTGIPLDVLTVIFGIVAVAIILFLSPWISYSHSIDFAQMAVLAMGGTVLAAWMTFYFMDVALRMKWGRGWRYSLIYMVLRWAGKTLLFMGRELAALARGIPLVMTTLIVYLGICILEFGGVILFIRDTEGVALWALEKVALLFAVLYTALMCRKLLEASKELADGRENYRVDTARMFGAFREHGENLNSLGLGISKAVEARMKSERMKTELISNVSHDLKTPLTSIINYAGLVWEEANPGGNASGVQLSGNGLPGDQDGKDTDFPNELSIGTEGKVPQAEISVALPINAGKIKEYAEVLLRQSRRLKRLLEDLVEASKVTTGNLEVNMEPCEVGVLLSQAVGEYQKRMEEKRLELVARQPETAVTVLADGRRLWRVFENLLNNICKYAQENSRVYLNVETGEDVRIIFRNMSKYPLDISAEELEERFVRGDKSRHMEGNGLGLSITKSLVELQDGQMEIVIDGDLFKVILSFPRYSKG